MRVGFNPLKDQPITHNNYNHQVIVPVYIPNQEGYFKDSFTIFQFCVESIIKTSHSKTFITIVNNGSCKEVMTYLDQLLSENKIHELIHTDNIGKMNAVLKGLVGHNIELVTVADSDVLFLPNWQQATVEVFNQFKKAGSVGLIPQFKTYGLYSSNILFDNLFSNKLKFTKVVNPTALQKFYHSIGWDENYKKAFLEWNLTIENSNQFRAIIGSGHVVTTYKRIVFDEITTYSGFKMGGDSESILDVIPLKKDLWRLTTEQNFAYHMGNVFEPWMEEEFNQLSSDATVETRLCNHYNPKPINWFLYLIKNRFFDVIWKNQKRLLYKYKGLPQDQVMTY
jgi:cellulose synthase/poly-beta-1,6-N-acetylglucosamine synthase-like glycosyltransferase